MSGKGGVRERYDANLKVRLTLALLQDKAGVAELAAEHDVPPEVLCHWRRAALLPLQRQAEGTPTPMAKLRKENRHLKCELKNAQREQAFFVQAFSKLGLPNAKR